MQAEKLLKSASKNYKIRAALDHTYSVDQNTLYMGRLRSNLTATNFFIFDDGLNPESEKSKIAQGGRPRKHLGTILYSDKDKFGKKVPRNMEVFSPLIDEKDENVAYWPETEMRKANIMSEYQN